MLAATLTICTALAACGGGQDRGQNTTGSTGFEFEGKVIEASTGAKGSTAQPASRISGVSKAGTITLQLSSSHTSSNTCSLAPPRVVVIPFSVNTTFEPMDLTAAESFPASLDGMTLNVRGNFRSAQNCSPMATSVKGVSEPQPESAASGQDPNGRSTAIEGSTSSQAGKNGSAAAAAAAEKPAPAPPPGAALRLPPLAPEVTTSFRPSLPDPPIR